MDPHPRSVAKERGQRRTVLVLGLRRHRHADPGALWQWTSSVTCRTFRDLSGLPETTPLVTASVTDTNEFCSVPAKCRHLLCRLWVVPTASCRLVPCELLSDGQFLVSPRPVVGIEVFCSRRPGMCLCFARPRDERHRFLPDSPTGQLGFRKAAFCLSAQALPLTWGLCVR